MEAPTPWQQIYKSIRSGDKKLYADLTNFLAEDKYCSKIIGQGSFGTIEDRSKTLIHKPDFLRGKPMDFTSLVVKELPVHPAKVAPESPGQTYPFYFDMKKEGGKLIIDTDNRPEVGGFASEVIANMLCTELFKRVSPHFTYLADFSFCGRPEDRTRHFEYYFENLGFDYHNTVTNRTRTISNIHDHLYMWQYEDIAVEDDMISGLLLSVFHSLYLMRINFDMTHFDMHIGNVYVKVLTDEKYFGGENMLKYKYFAYHIDNKVYYVKNYGFIIKIGDLGLAQFTLGNTKFTNNYARLIRRPQDFVPYCKKYGQYPDFMLFLSHIISRFSQKYTALERIKEVVHPFNKVKGCLPLDFMEDNYFIPFDPLKIPTLKDLILNMKIFDNLLKPPKIADSHILHIYDQKIVNDL